MIALIAELQIMGARDILSVLAGGGIAVYLFKLWHKGQEEKIQVMSRRIKELEEKFEKLNEEYIAEVEKRATAEAENAELRRTIKRLDSENKDLKKDKGNIAQES